MQRGNSFFNHLQIIGECGYQQPRREKHENPRNRGVGDAEKRHKFYSLLNARVFASAEIIAQNGLRAACDALNGEMKDIAHGVDYRHYSDVQIAADELQRGVAHNLHRAVCRLHDKRGQAERRDFSDKPQVDFHIFSLDFQQRFLPRQEFQHPNRRYNLADNRGDCRAFYTHLKHEYEQRVKREVENRADCRGEHSDFWETLRVDESVQACREHQKRRPDEVDFEVIVGVDVGIFACAEQKQHRFAENIARAQQNPRAYQKQ